jgi:hypothetical protein
MEFATTDSGFEETAARRFVLTNATLFALTLSHALLTWPLADVLALFGGGIVVAFVAEAGVIRVGLLRHHVRPQVLGVPGAVLLGWPAFVYAAVRVAGLFLADPVAVAALAAVLATLVDVVVDPPSLEEGAWAYPQSRLSGTRYRGVPWWNFAGWLAVVFLTAMLPTLV